MGAARHQCCWRCPVPCCHSQSPQDWGPVRKSRDAVGGSSASQVPRGPSVGFFQFIVAVVTLTSRGTAVFHQDFHMTGYLLPVHACWFRLALTCSSLGRSWCCMGKELASRSGTTSEAGMSSGISEPWEHMSSDLSSGRSSVLVLPTSGVPLGDGSLAVPSSTSDGFSELKVDRD